MRLISKICVTILAVTLINGCGSGSNPPSPPAAPHNVSITSGSGYVMLKWTALPSDRSFNLYWSDREDVSKASGTRIAGVSSPYMHLGLDNGKSYYYVMTAVNEGGESRESVTLSAIPKISPGVPQIAAVAGDRQVTLYWQPNPEISSYNVYWGTTPITDKSQAYRVSASSDHSIVTGLENGVRYYFMVSAVQGGMEGIPSNQASAQPLPPPPGMPQNFSAVAGDGKVTLSWDPNPAATSYTIYWSYGPGVNTWSASIPGITGTSYSYTGLMNWQPYYFRIAAVGPGGPSVLSGEIAATPLGVPSGVTVTQNGPSAVDISWNPVAGAYLYTIYVSNSPGVNKQTGTILVTGVSAATFSHIGLTSGATYYYVVTATSWSGEGGESAVVSFTVP